MSQYQINDSIINAAREGITWAISFGTFTIAALMAMAVIAFAIWRS